MSYVNGVAINNGVSEQPRNMNYGEPPPPYTLQDTIIRQDISNETIIHQTIIVHRDLSDSPVLIDCPSCHKRVMTTLQYVNSRKTHLLAGFICGLTMWCMLCCLSAIPYTIKKFKKAEHYCSNCNYFLGTAP